MDTLRERAICVSLDSGKIYKFNNYDEGLYYFDMAEHEQEEKQVPQDVTQDSDNTSKPVNP